MSAHTPTDPELWALAVQAMREQGSTEQTARAFLGLCLKVWPEGEVRQAVMAAAGKADFRAYCRAVLARRPRRKVEARQMALAEPVDWERGKADYAAARAKLWGALKR